MEFIADTDTFTRALRTVDRELSKETRRRVSAIARRERDRVRGDWPTGPAKGGHSKLAVVSGTQGVNPYLGLRRGYRPYIGWLVFGGRRPRDQRARRAPVDGYWFYPGIVRARAQVYEEVYAALQDAKRRAGL